MKRVVERKIYPLARSRVGLPAHLHRVKRYQEYNPHDRALEAMTELCYLLPEFEPAIVESMRDPRLSIPRQNVIGRATLVNMCKPVVYLRLFVQAGVGSTRIDGLAAEQSQDNP